MFYTYKIEGMHCAACVEKIKLALLPHFKMITVTLDPPRLKIEADKPPLLSDLNAYIQARGKYLLKPIEKVENKPVKALKKDPVGFSAYFPLFLIAAYIIGVAAINNVYTDRINWDGFMCQFMAGFFLVFSAFKLLDIDGFAEGYATYDLLARRFHSYGYIYPFLELSLGILYLTNWLPTFTQIATIIIMGFSSIGVINSLFKKQKFQCACLGTILKVPLSSITLIEDLTMVVLAALTLMIR